MVLIFLLYIGLCLYGIKLHRNFNDHYLSLENTQAIKGVFIILVFLSYFNSYVSFEKPLDIF